ncbi:Putative oxidoreductase [Streptomyces hygroscopicus subsp. limoneus]|nr:Putative oxidoreductase [Streptomyces hygroscopicus subsp. limoneus]
MKRLEGKVALISGTARGRGRAAALRFAAEGAPFGIRANCVILGRIDMDGSRASLLADDHPLRDIVRPIPLGRTGTSDDVVDAR